jgi:hypothetical protein
VWRSQTRPDRLRKNCQLTLSAISLINGNKRRFGVGWFDAHSQTLKRLTKEYRSLGLSETEAKLAAQMDLEAYFGLQSPLE